MPVASTLSQDPALEAHLFWFRYRRELLMAIGIIVLALLVFAGYWLYQNRRDAAAAELLAGAHDANAYQQVIDRYENTDAGATAYLLLADADRKAAKYAEANAVLQKFIEKHPKHDFVATARTAIAANLISLGRNDEALAAYQRVAADYPMSFEAPFALMSQVTLLKAKNQNDAARRICETVLTQYRDSIWASQAMQELRMLKPPEIEPAPGLPAGPALGGQGPNAPPPMLARPPAAPAPVIPPPSAAPNGKPPGSKP
jgi:tetratricopeptide (TPR) repeat protein